MNAVTMRLLPPLVLAVAAGLAACASDPPTRFHSLQSATATDTAAVAPQRLVDLGPVAVPPAVDQPQWVVRLPDGSLRVLEQERWVAPLRDELRAALLAGLRERQATGDVRTAAPPAPAAWRVRVDVTRLDTLAGQGAWLEAGWTAVPPSGGAGFACAVSLREDASGDPLALAGAHRKAVGRLADRIGASLAAGRCEG
jgi:uncharacterized lipoprotein YmbA